MPQNHKITPYDNTSVDDLGAKYTRGFLFGFDYVYTTAVVLCALCILLCLISCLFGVISWILIPRWRSFRNYVFVNVFFACAVTMSCYFVINNVYPRTKTFHTVIIFMFVLSRIAMCHWLFVATVMFYMDIVRVFHTNFKRMYLIVNLFAWLLPVVEVSISFSVSIPLKVDSSCVLFFTCTVLCVLLLATGMLYLRVLYTLISLAIQSIGCKEELCQKIILCTAGCITSGISSFLPVVVAEIVFKDDYVVINSICIVSLLHIIAIVLYFLNMKANRAVWSQYWRRRRSLASDLGEIAIIS